MEQQMCMVNEQGKLIEILQRDRKPQEGEYKVPLEGYYECLNEKRYPDAEYRFKFKKWVGVGEQRPKPVIEPTGEQKRMEMLENYILDMDFRILSNEFKI